MFKFFNKNNKEKDIFEKEESCVKFLTAERMTELFEEYSKESIPEIVCGKIQCFYEDETKQYIAKDFFNKKDYISFLKLSKATNIINFDWVLNIKENSLKIKLNSNKINKKQIGGFWDKISKNKNEWYLSGKINDLATSISIFIEKNNKYDRMPVANGFWYILDLDNKKEMGLLSSFILENENDLGFAGTIILANTEKNIIILPNIDKKGKQPDYYVYVIE